MNPEADWTEQMRRLVDGVRSLMADATRNDDGTAHGSDCRWCPLCRLAAVVRGEHPEVSAALADLLTTTAAALRSFAEAPTAGPPEAADETGDPPPEVQRIEIA